MRRFACVYGYSIKFGVTDDDEAEGTRQGGWGSTGR